MGVRDVERGAVAVSALRCGVPVVLSQLIHVGSGAQNGGDDQLLKGISLRGQAIEERTPDFFEERCGVRHEIGDAVVERPYMKIGIVADVDQFVGAPRGGVSVFARRDAYFSSRVEVLGIEVGKGFGISVDMRNRVGRFLGVGGY